MKKGFALLAAAVVIMIITCACGGTENSLQNNHSSIDDKSSSGESLAESEETEATVPQSTSPEQTSSPEDSAPQPGQSTEVPDIRSQIVQTAEAMIGIDFVTGGASPEIGFDNSGLIYYVLRENGYINCPRATYDQKNMGTIIGIDELQPGDLVFFVDRDSTVPDDIGFGGIYIGDNKLIYSPYPGEKVKYADLSGSYWYESFERAVRVF